MGHEVAYRCSTGAVIGKLSLNACFFLKKKLMTPHAVSVSVRRTPFAGRVPAGGGCCGACCGGGRGSTAGCALGGGGGGGGGGAAPAGWVTIICQRWWYNFF